MATHWRPVGRFFGGALEVFSWPINLPSVGQIMLSFADVALYLPNDKLVNYVVQREVLLASRGIARQRLLVKVLLKQDDLPPSNVQKGSVSA